MSRLQTFFKEIKKASVGHKISSVGIELGSSSIKIVNFVEDKGIVSLNNYGEIDLGPFADKPRGSVANLETPKLQEAIQVLLKNVPIETPEAVTVAIPLSATLVISIEIDAHDKSDIDALVKKELETKVPVPLTSVHIGWQIVDESPIDSEKKSSKPTSEDEVRDLVEDEIVPTKTVSLLCYVVNKEIIESYQTVVESLGFEIEHFELEVYSVLRSAVGKDVVNAMIVDIGARYTKFYVVEQGKIVHAVKNLQGGVDFTNTIKDMLNIDFAKAETLKRNLHLESIAESKVAKSLRDQISDIASSVKTLSKDYFGDQSVPIYLCGGGSLLYGLPEHLASSLNSKIIICQPFINTNAPQYLDKLLVETGPEYAVAAGLALKYIRNI